MLHCAEVVFVQERVALILLARLNRGLERCGIYDVSMVCDWLAYIERKYVHLYAYVYSWRSHESDA